jgi:Holliday junction resolvase RusA-like endonuclease
MTLIAEFVVPGKPVPKARPRFHRATGRVYTPAKSAKYEKAVGAAAFHASRWAQHDEKSWARRAEPWPEPNLCARERPRRTKAAARCQCAWCASTFAVGLRIFLPDRRARDIDNIAKAVLDGCTGVLWRDDKQVTSSSQSSQLSRTNPRVEVRVELRPPAQGSLLEEDPTVEDAQCTGCEGRGMFEVTLPVSGKRRELVCNDCAGSGRAA